MKMKYVRGKKPKKNQRINTRLANFPPRPPPSQNCDDTLIFPFLILEASIVRNFPNVYIQTQHTPDVQR